MDETPPEVVIISLGSETAVTHFAALVITPDCLDDDGMEQVLWPWCYDNPDTREPRFDYFRIGGRFEGSLDPDWSHEGCKPVRDSSQKRKRDLDLATLRTQAEARKASLYDRVEAALDGRRIPDMEKLVRDHGEEEGRKRFDADPAVQAVLSVERFLWTESIVRLAQPRDVVLARARRLALVTNAVVSGGVWHASGLFNMDEDPARTEVWAELSDRLIANATPDDWLTIVDCHC